MYRSYGSLFVDHASTWVVVFFPFLNEHNLVKTASPYGHLVAWVPVVLMFINEPVEWCYSPTFDFLQ